jgi:hypothetical protein
MTTGVRLSATLLAALLVCAAADAQQSAPVPDFEAFYKATRENLARAQRSVHLYAFKERRTELHTNPFGRIGTDGTRLAEVYPSANRQLTYRRIIARNGMPVPASELMEQDREYRARVAEFQRRAAGRTEEERRRRDEEQALARRRGQMMIEDVVDTLQFKLEGRDMHQGVQTVVVTFTPRANARPSTREGRIAQKFAGTVWIHEADSEVMRVEAKAVDDLSFGFGIIARLDQGTAASLVRRPVDRDIWMPTELRLKGRGRAALVRRLVIDFAIEWFDYRRLPGDSATPFLEQ